MQHTVIGIFRSSGEAETALERLRSNGFSEQDIDQTDRSSTYDTTASDTPYSVNDENRYDDARTGNYTTTTSDTLNEDRIRSREQESDKGNDFGDSIGRFFRNLFDNKDEAEKYSDMSRRNHTISVYANSREEAERAADILDECGAININESSDADFRDNISESKTADTTLDTNATGRDRNVTNVSDYDNRRDADLEEKDDLGPDKFTDRSIPVIEENLNVGKREVESGGVRLRSRIVERPVEERIRLREERVSVERNPVNRPATEEDFAAFREGEIELTEKSEVPIVNKEARVVEEVRLRKDVEEREEVVGDTVRQTDVQVENLDKEETKSKRKRTK